MKHWVRETLRKFSLRIEPAASEVKGERSDHCATEAPQSPVEIVSPVEIPHTSEITRCVYQHFDPNQPSTDFGIEIFTQVLTFIVNKLEELM